MTEKPKIPRAPIGLRKEALKLWKEIHSDFDVDPAGRETLRVACLSLSEYLNADEKLREQGHTFLTPNGFIKKNPLLEVSKIARNGFLSAMKDLGLDYSDEKKSTNLGRPKKGWC